MTLVVNGVCRFAFNGFYIDRPWVNICDMRLDTTGAIYDRDDWIWQTAGRLINGWVNELAPRLSDVCVLNNVSWVDLDSESGYTGMRASTSEATLPDAGTNTNTPQTGNISILVTKETRSARGHRNGRWYQCGVTENQTSDNMVTAQSLGNLQDSFDAFKSYIEEPSDPIGGAQRYMAVVHTTGANPTVGTSSDVESLNVEGRLATQRRRLRS